MIIIILHVLHVFIIIYSIVINPESRKAGLWLEGRVFTVKQISWIHVPIFRTTIQNLKCQITCHWKLDSNIQYLQSIFLHLPEHCPSPVDGVTLNRNNISLQFVTLLRYVFQVVLIYLTKFFLSDLNNAPFWITLVGNLSV